MSAKREMIRTQNVRTGAAFCGPDAPPVRDNHLERRSIATGSSYEFRRVSLISKGLRDCRRDASVVFQQGDVGFERCAFAQPGPCATRGNGVSSRPPTRLFSASCKCRIQDALQIDAGTSNSSGTGTVTSKARSIPKLAGRGRFARPPQANQREHRPASRCCANKKPAARRIDNRQR